VILSAIGALLIAAFIAAGSAIRHRVAQISGETD
jgi:hypothetical protein